MKKISVVWIPRMAIFLLSCYALFFLTALLPIPSPYGLGETRIMLVALVSRLLEEVIYTSLKKSIIQIEELPIKIK